MRLKETLATINSAWSSVRIFLVLLLTAVLLPLANDWHCQNLILIWRVPRSDDSVGHCQVLKGRFIRGILLPEHAPGHDPGAKLLRVYQRFHGYTSSSRAEFPPRKMLHDIKQVKYLGASSRGKLSELENAPSCVLTRAKWAWRMLREQNPSCVSALKLSLSKWG